MGEKLKCSFDDCTNEGKYLVRGRTPASGEIQAMVCEACMPRLSKNTKDISMGTEKTDGKAD